VSSIAPENTTATSGKTVNSSTKLPLYFYIGFQMIVAAFPTLNLVGIIHCALEDSLLLLEVAFSTAVRCMWFREGVMVAKDIRNFAYICGLNLINLTLFLHK
jgi:hypothetical protein